jgi:hypothetical protein
MSATLLSALSHNLAYYIGTAEVFPVLDAPVFTAPATPTDVRSLRRSSLTSGFGMTWERVRMNLEMSYAAMEAWRES